MARYVYTMEGNEDGLMGVWGGLNKSCIARIETYIHRELNEKDKATLSSMRKGNDLVGFFEGENIVTIYKELVQ